VPFGYGALISDVRAVWPNGQHLDVLQKVYPVGPWMMAGFSGSVLFGFQTIADMQRFSGDVPLGHSYAPEEWAWRWHRRARRAFAGAPAEIQKRTSSILLVGVSPCPHQGIPMTRCIIMRSPTFRPERGKPFCWSSIGIGGSQELAEHLANQNLATFANTHGKGEVMNPGGVAKSVAMFVTMELWRTPTVKVSDQFQVGTVWAGKHDIQTLHGTRHGSAWSQWQTAPSVSLATTWDAFTQVAGSAGLQAAAAET
jgi:hypothetical protein